MNTCYYDNGSKHELCTHPEYCIFNKKRTILEQTITKLENKIKTLETTVTLLEFDEIQFNIKYYKKTLKKLNTTTDELNRLKKYRKNIKRGDGYGYSNNN